MPEAPGQAPPTALALIDTHCHLEMAPFEPDRSAVIERSFASGMEALITVASDPESNTLAQQIAESHERIYCTVGLHPHEARLLDDALKAELRALCSRPKTVAVGETGLDYHYDHSPRSEQKSAFIWQLALARETDLPVVVHSREADLETIEILKEAAPKRGVLHCFSGSPRLLDYAIKAGLHISIAGPVTFPKARELRDIVRHIPDELLLVETDAPYLTPVPNRGKRNEPAYVAYTAAEVAALRGVTPADIARITTLNARRLFKIGEVPAKGAIAYKIRQSLYLNVTNRCTNRCIFCVRSQSDFVKGHNLRLDHEPTTEELIRAIGDPRAYSEIVFCGYGEPLMRIEVVREVAAWVKSGGGRVRINTNGQGSLIHKRNIVPELAGLVDVYSVSLDAQDRETYNRLCLPAYEGAYEAVVDFIREAARTEAEVYATVVETEGVDMEACRTIVDGLGAKLRIRKLDVVG